MLPLWTVTLGLLLKLDHAAAVSDVPSIIQPAKGLLTIQPAKKFLKKMNTKSARVVGGQIADEDEWPWHVSLQYHYSSYYHICGGAIISSRWILTAAHCVHGQTQSNLRIEAGINKVSENGQYSSIRAVIIHPDYDPNGASYPNDIALIKLSTPLTLADDIQTVSLPANRYQEFFGIKDCWISGWGKLDASHGSGPDVLYEAQMPSISNSECRSRWSVISGPAIYDYHICLFKPTTSGCSGDSGGPYVCKVNGTYILAGVKSWGISTCSGYYPTVCTRVSFFLDWIGKFI